MEQRGCGMSREVSKQLTRDVSNLLVYYKHFTISISRSRCVLAFRMPLRTFSGDGRNGLRSGTGTGVVVLLQCLERVHWITLWTDLFVFYLLYVIETFSRKKIKKGCIELHDQIGTWKVSSTSSSSFSVLQDCFELHEAKGTWKVSSTIWSSFSLAWKNASNYMKTNSVNWKLARSHRSRNVEFFQFLF